VSTVSLGHGERYGGAEEVRRASLGVGGCDEGGTTDSSWPWRRPFRVGVHRCASRPWQLRARSSVSVLVCGPLLWRQFRYGADRRAVRRRAGPPRSPHPRPGRTTLPARGGVEFAAGKPRQYGSVRPVGTLVGSVQRNRGGPGAPDGPRHPELVVCPGFS
jgi:hypothetical protein